MNITRHITARTLLLVAFVCCAFFAQVEADSTSDQLAQHWQNIKGSLPHPRIPTVASQISDTSSWAMPYAIGVGKIVGLGFAIAFLSVLIGLFYGIFKIIRACCRHICCTSEDEESGKSDTDEDYTTFKRHWCPTIAYAIAWIFVLTGMAIGLQNNPKFSEGVDSMGNSVVTIGNDAIALGNGLLNSVEGIVALIPQTITGIEDQFAGVNALANNVTLLSNNVNATSFQINNITAEVGAINAGNTTALASLFSQLSGINNQSVQIVGSMSKLTGEVATKLQSTYNSTVGTLNEKVGDIDQTVDGLVNTAKGIIKQASDLVSSVVTYVNSAKTYDQSRAKGVTALFVLVIFVPLIAIFGYAFHVKFPFNIVTAFSFVFLFFLWLSGSIHFLLGMVLYDACPVVDTAVQGMLPKGSTAATVLDGCLYEDRTVLQSLNITAYNLSAVFDYKDQFTGFSDFSKSFNFSSIDSYFTSIQSLYKYNLSALADNTTVASFGWNETVIYTALNGMNNQTEPDFYVDLSNYTTVDPNHWAPPKNQTVYEYQIQITNLLEVNQTIYNKTAMAKQQLYAAQGDINNLVATMGSLQSQFGAIKAVINQLQTQNITNCVGYLNYLEANITGFFNTGNCSFLGEQFGDIKGALCEEMQPAIDCLTVGQFLAGLAIIAILILAEVLSFRWPKSIFVNPLRSIFGGSDDDDGYSSKKKEEKNGYAIAMTDSPAQRRTALTATIGSGPPGSTDSSPAGTPDFNASRKLLKESSRSGVVLPPIIARNNRVGPDQSNP